VYNELLTPFFMVNERLWKYVDLYRHYEEEIQRIGKEQVMADLYHRLFEAEPAESNQYLYRWGQQLLIYDRDLMGTPRYMDFCGHSLPCPEKTVDFLRATYGDNWIYLPDEQNRETHTSNMHPDIAYCNWLRDIRPAIDSDKALADFVTRKEWNVQKAIPAHEMQVIGYTQNALLTQMEFESDPKLSYSALAALSAPELLTRVDGYLRTQISGPYLKNDIYVNIPDETVALILRALLKHGEFARAGKLLAARAKRGPLTEELAAVNEQFLTIRSLVRYFEDRYVDEGDVESLAEMAPKLKTALTAYPDHLNLLRCQLQYVLLSAPAATDEAVARHAVAAFPADTELAYWAGSVLERCGHTADAAALYEQAAATSNGVILMYLTDKTHEGGHDND
jgi:hypothetical protein